MKIVQRLVANQPGVLVELMRRRLLSPVSLRRLLELDKPEGAGVLPDWMLGHDAYRRVGRRIQQVRWSA